jgi:hypothetical protein
MPLQKFKPSPGVNRENTRLFNEGGWWDADKVRFRQGTPERIGGWARLSAQSFRGICRSLWTWANFDSTVLNAVGTHLKAYISAGGGYNDITPARSYATYSGPFVATPGSSVVTVTAAAHGAATGDFVTFSGALALSTQTFTVTIATPAVVTLAVALAENTPVTLQTTGALPTGLAVGPTYYAVGVSGLTCRLANVPSGAEINTTGAQSGVHTLAVSSGITATVLNANYQLTATTINTYTVDFGVLASVYDTATGGGTVNVCYEIGVGNALAVASSGWGAGTWGSGAWGVGGLDTIRMRIWNFANFGQDLLYGVRGASLYYWSVLQDLSAQPVTVTIGTPAVVTWHTALPANTAVILQTSGALPTGLTAGTVYYVKSPTGATSNLAATPGGANIDTTGTQSGTHSLSQRGIPLTSLSGASDVPLLQTNIVVSDTSRFVLALGVNPIGTTEIDPMFIRWSDQESAVNWTPAATNQAGGIRLSKGSVIVAALQTRQEIVVWTDAALYSLQYLGPPYVWGTQLLGDNTSIIGPNAVAVASGVIYWMGADKFYKYDGRVQTLKCDVQRFVFEDINRAQREQFFAGTVEGFNEVWFFYCTEGSDTVDRYAIYNYGEDVWCIGQMARTAWIDSGLNSYPLAATYSDTLVFHEYGVDDNTTGTPVAIESFILSTEFDIGDGHNFGFVWRLLPDLTFRGSTAASPALTITLNALQNAGSGYNSPASVGGSAAGTSVRTVTYPVEEFTGQLNVRVRGRQMSMEVRCNTLGTVWQLGATRIDVRLDGRA